MAERQTTTQVVNIGLESTAGTAVTAAHRMQAMSVETALAPNVTMHRPAGEKFSTVQSNDAEWTTATLGGRGTYTELVVPLSSALGAATVTTPGGATDARQWAWSLHPTTPIAPGALTVETGDAVRAHRFSYGVVTALDLEMSRRNGVALSGQMIGRRISDGVTLNGSAAALGLVPMIGNELDFYVDDAVGDLGTTKLTRAFRAKLMIGERYGPIWPVDSSQDSFAAVVELVPTVKCELELEADASGMAFVDNLRDGSSVFVRLTSTGPEIESGQNYSLEVDIAGKVSAVGRFSDNDGVYAITFTFDAVPELDSGASGLDVRLVNNIASL